MQVVGAFHDLEGELQGGRGPGDQLAGVAAVGPCEPDLGERLLQVPQQWPGRVAVLDAGGGDQHGQQQADRVDGDVPLAAVDLLPGVVAAAGSGGLLGGLHRLGVDDRGGRRGLAAGYLADPVAQLVMHGLGGSVGLPLGGPVVDGPGRREVGGQRPPHRAVVREVADAVDDVAHAVAGRAAALARQPGRMRQQRLAHRPLGAAHV